MKKIRPFSNGSQDAAWQDRNCIDCDKWQDNKGKEICEISAALTVACFDDGDITEEIAKRMGYTKDSYIWDCPEKYGE